MHGAEPAPCNITRASDGAGRWGGAAQGRFDRYTAGATQRSARRGRSADNSRRLRTVLWGACRNRRTASGFGGCARAVTAAAAAAAVRGVCDVPAPAVFMAASDKQDGSVFPCCTPGVGPCLAQSWPPHVGVPVSTCGPFHLGQLWALSVLPSAAALLEKGSPALVLDALADAAAPGGWLISSSHCSISPHWARVTPCK